VPAQVAADWRGCIDGLGGGWTIRIHQSRQMLYVDAGDSGSEILARASRLRGREIKLSVGGLVGGRPGNLLLTGRAEGARIAGRVRSFDGQTEEEPIWSATRVQ